MARSRCCERQGSQQTVPGSKKAKKDVPEHRQEFADAKSEEAPSPPAIDLAREKNLEAVEKGEPASGLAVGFRRRRWRNVGQEEKGEEGRENEEAERDLKGIDNTKGVGDDTTAYRDVLQ